MPSSYILTFLILEFAAFSIEILQEKKISFNYFSITPVVS